MNVVFVMDDPALEQEFLALCKANGPNSPARPRIVRAQYKAEVDKAQAQAAQSGPLAEAQAQREVLEMRTELAERAAELRQQELVAEVVKPAEAEAERVRIMAVADAEKMKIQAEAAASHNRVALDKMLIDQLPLIVEKAALGSRQFQSHGAQWRRRPRPGGRGVGLPRRGDFRRAARRDCLRRRRQRSAGRREFPRLDSPGVFPRPPAPHRNARS